MSLPVQENRERISLQLIARLIFGESVCLEGEFFGAHDFDLAVILNIA